jgi:hypothetical protein
MASAAATIVALAVVLVIALTSGGNRGARHPAHTGPAPTNPPAQAAPAREQFGANVNRLFDDQLRGHGLSPAQVTAQLTALHATGATLARGDTLWEITEPQQPVNGIPHYDWRFDDLTAAALAAQGLQWLPVIDYSAAWARATPGALHSPPASTSSYGAFTGAFAARYGTRGTFWRTHPELSAQPVTTYEIWNEPDSGAFWTPRPNAPAYAELYAQARERITAADPHARVIVGGLVNPLGFLPALLAAAPQLRGHIDGVAIHPYAPTPQAVLGKVRAARRTLDQLGLGSVPLYVTEFGWVTHPAHAPHWAAPGARPRYILETISSLAHSGCGIAATIIYTWFTPQHSRDSGGDWFGIHPPDGGSSPDTQAFAAGIRTEIRAAPAARTCGQ